MRIASVILVSLTILLMLAGTAFAAWPSGAQGDQYAPVNAALQTAVAGVGISPDTFIGIYNAAVAGDVSGYSEEQRAAACEVLGSLTGYQDVLTDYGTVYNNLGCGTSVVSAGPSRSDLPSTGIALALVLGSGAFGTLAASRLIGKNRR